MNESANEHLNYVGEGTEKIELKFAELFPDARVVRLTMSEVQLFLEGSPLVGRVALSPAPFAFDETQKILARGARR